MGRLLPTGDDPVVIEVRDDGVLLLDLGTESGTRIDGEPITRHTPLARDRITIDDHELVVG